MRNLVLGLLMVVCSCVAQNDSDPGSGSGSGSGSDPAPLPAASFAFVQADTGLEIMDLSTQATKAIETAPDKVSGISIAPDRKHLVFTTGDAVFVVGSDGSDLHQISDALVLPPDQYPQLDTPEWSPDGKTIYVSYGLFNTNGGAGGSTLATLPANGGTVAMLQPAIDTKCTIEYGPRFTTDGSHVYAIHAVCLDDNADRGLWQHTPDGAGTLVIATNLELSKPVAFPDGSVLALGVIGGVNGLVLIKNGAIAAMQAPPAGLSMDALALSPDGNSMVVAMHDENTFAKNLFVTTDLVNFAPLTTDGKSTWPAF